MKTLTASPSMARLAAIILFTSSFIFHPSSLLSQGFNYQAVVRNASGEVIASTEVSLRLSIVKGGASGTAVFVETHTKSTNQFGLVSLAVGSGTVASGNFDDIDWAADTYFLKVGLDPTGGNTYTELGVSQILSVPYALHARESDKLKGSITESQISDLKNYLTEEKDPIFNASPAQRITGTNITDWNTAFGWGDHAGLYRPISYVPSWDEIASKPSTLEGFGITDGVNTTVNQSINGNKTFTGTTTVAEPVNPTDAATKAYVDAVLSKLSTAGAILADAEGNIYSTVRLGSQVWMIENLKTTKYNDGTDIPPVTDGTEWSSLTTPGYCWYDNNEANKDTYGALYNWYTVSTGKLCPAGWHVPTDAEWTTLENYLIAHGYNYDGTTTENKIAKSLAATTNWTASTNTGAVGNTDYPVKRNATGFTGLPGGLRFYTGTFMNIDTGGYWWSASENDTANAWIRFLLHNASNAPRNNFNKECGFSVRCVKD